jgi:non-heme chloroperoxidase
MDSFATTDFRDDLKKLTVPTLVIHGAADAIVPFEGSGQRTHRAVPQQAGQGEWRAARVERVARAAFNDALLSFLRD